MFPFSCDVFATVQSQQADLAWLRLVHISSVGEKGLLLAQFLFDQTQRSQHDHSCADDGGDSDDDCNSDDDNDKLRILRCHC